MIIVEIKRPFTQKKNWKRLKTKKSIVFYKRIGKTYLKECKTSNKKFFDSLKSRWVLPLVKLSNRTTETYMNDKTIEVTAFFRKKLMSYSLEPSDFN